MAYTAPPSRRLGFHRDGSAMFIWDDGQYSTTKIAPAEIERTTLNNEDADYYITQMPHGIMVGIIFPVPVDLTHMFLSMSSESGTITVSEIEASTDTNTGDDGTWVTPTLGTSLPYTPPTLPGTSYRESIIQCAATGVRGIRFKVNTTYAVKLRCIHFYGMINVATTQRLAFVDGSGNELTIDRDFGDKKRDGTATTKQFYIKNMSSTKTANTVVVKFLASGIFEYGDALNQLSGWIIKNINANNSSRDTNDMPTVYWVLTVSESTRTVSLYKAASTSSLLIAQGSRANGTEGTITLTEQNSSGVSGSVFIKGSDSSPAVTTVTDNDIASNKLCIVLDSASPFCQIKETTAGTYADSVTFASLAPGATQNLTAQITIPTNAELGLHFIQLFIEAPASWA